MPCACSAPAHPAPALQRQQATGRSSQRRDTATGSPGPGQLSAGGLAAKPHEGKRPPSTEQGSPSLGYRLRYLLHPSLFAEVLHEGRKTLLRAESLRRNTNKNLPRVVLFS